MSFDEALAKANKTSRPMSIFYFLSDLKPFFVEVLTFLVPVAVESFHFSRPNCFEVCINVPVSVRLGVAIIFCSIVIPFSCFLRGGGGGEHILILYLPFQIFFSIY